jgi:hypothetical protein
LKITSNEEKTFDKDKEIYSTRKLQTTASISPLIIFFSYLNYYSEIQSIHLIKRELYLTDLVLPPKKYELINEIIIYKKL